MDMGAGGLAAHGLPESEVGEAMRFQVLAEPEALGLVRMDSDVHAVTMIETEGAVHRGFPHGTDRQRFAEMSGESRLHQVEIESGEQAAAVETRGKLMCAGASALGGGPETPLQPWRWQ